MIFDFIAYIYFVLILVLIGCYLCILMNWDLVSTDAVAMIRHIIQGLIAIYLLLRFHPFQNKVVILKGSDVDIIFASATFLLFHFMVESYSK